MPSAEPLYDGMFRRLERARWDLADIEFERIDRSRLTDGTIAFVRVNCLMELSSLYAQRMFLRDFRAWPDFCQFTSIWYYEEMKHYLVLREYLKALRAEPDSESYPELDTELSPSPWPATLALHYCGEMRLGTWYHLWGRLLEEPVLAGIYRLIGDDEFRHAGCYRQFMERALARDPALLIDFLQAMKWMLVNPRGDKHPTTMKADQEGDLAVTDKIDGYEAMRLQVQGTVTEQDENWIQAKVLGTASRLAGRELASLADLAALTRELQRSGKANGRGATPSGAAAAVHG